MPRQREAQEKENIYFERNTQRLENNGVQSWYPRISGAGWLSCGGVEVWWKWDVCKNQLLSEDQSDFLPRYFLTLNSVAKESSSPFSSMTPRSQSGGFSPPAFSPGANTLKVQRRIYRHSYGMAFLCQSYSFYGHRYMYQILDQGINSSAWTLSQAPYRLSGKAAKKCRCRRSSSTLFLRNNFCSFSSDLEEKFSCLPTGTGFQHRCFFVGFYFSDSLLQQRTVGSNYL